MINMNFRNNFTNLPVRFPIVIYSNLRDILTPSKHSFGVQSPIIFIRNIGLTYYTNKFIMYGCNILKYMYVKRKS